MSLNANHKRLLRESLKREISAESTSNVERRKRRAVKSEGTPTTPIAVDLLSSDELEDVELEDVHFQDTELNTRSPLTTPQHHEEDDEFDDLQDVDLDALLHQPAAVQTDTLTFSINGAEEQQTTKKKTFQPVNKEERLRRKLIHKLYLVLMVLHGIVRNKWCNDRDLERQLALPIPSSTRELFHQDRTQVLENVKSRRFNEGLQKVMLWYRKKFRVFAEGLIYKDWGHLRDRQDRAIPNVNLAKFKRLLCKHRGSRDLGAQGFVALLRGLGVNARLVFSLQPPDFRSITPADSELATQSEPIHEKPKGEFDPVFIPNTKENFLRGLRNVGSPEPKFKPLGSAWPVFWIEAWNKWSKSWITIDPIVFKVVEVMPMRRKSKFESPLKDSTHQTTYVLAFDKFGSVKDVTRRYSRYFYAQTVKRRIASASDDDEIWYEQLIRGANCRARKKHSLSSILEAKEFHDRDVCEGFPNNLEGFRNHPIYALASQLKQDEVIYPEDDSSKCGTYKVGKKQELVNVYKRSHVHKLRTPNGWRFRGRVLKIGMQPLKIRPKKRAFMEEEDDNEERLYAEFQTKLFIPEPIVDGKITKNFAGNVEVFVPSMLPENGYIVPSLDLVSVRALERAAKDILKIDCARAIVGFDFEGGGKRNRTPKPKEGGLLIDIRFKDAMEAVLEGLAEFEKETLRKNAELQALRLWKVFYKKLQIMKRLDQNHGKVDGSDESDAYAPSEEENGGFFAEERIGFTLEDEGSDLKEKDDSAEESTEPLGNADAVPEKSDELSDGEGGGFLFDGEENGGFIADNAQNSPVSLTDFAGSPRGPASGTPGAEVQEPFSNSGGGFLVEGSGPQSPAPNIVNGTFPDPIGQSGSSDLTSAQAQGHQGPDNVYPNAAAGSRSKEYVPDVTNNSALRFSLTQSNMQIDGKAKTNTNSTAGGSGDQSSAQLALDVEEMAALDLEKMQEEEEALGFDFESD